MHSMDILQELLFYGLLEYIFRLKLKNQSQKIINC